MRKAIEMRSSKRSFTESPISGSQADIINKMISDINLVSGLELTFVEDGRAAFRNLRKTYGMFKNVHSMILMKGRTDLPDLKEKIGYYGEGLMLDIVDMGLGTCWVGGTFERDSFDIKEGERIVCVMLVGNIGTPGIKDKLISQNGKRKDISERLTSDCKPPEWLLGGMEAVRLAPSAMNKQKPHFSYQSGVLTATVPDDYEMDLVDLGIAKRNFEIEAGGHFAFGNGGKYSK